MDSDFHPDELHDNYHAAEYDFHDHNSDHNDQSHDDGHNHDHDFSSEGHRHILITALAVGAVVLFILLFVFMHRRIKQLRHQNGELKEARERNVEKQVTGVPKRVAIADTLAENCERKRAVAESDRVQGLGGVFASRLDQVKEEDEEKKKEDKQSEDMVAEQKAVQQIEQWKGREANGNTDFITTELGIQDDSTSNPSNDEKDASPKSSWDSKSVDIPAIIIAQTRRFKRAGP